MRPHLAVALLAGSILLPDGAAARTIRFPEAKPAVMFEVPDDWDVAPVDGGLRLSAPDRTSIILAGMAKPDKADLAGWQKAAAQRMVEFGVAFDRNAKAPGTRSAAEESRITALLGPDTQPKMKADELQPLSTVPSMALLGQVPESTIANMTGIGAQSDRQAKKNAPGSALRFNSAVIYGATLAGKPVDVQFLNFALDRDRSFVMQQESGADDGRAGAIIKSVRSTR